MLFIFTVAHLVVPYAFSAWKLPLGRGWLPALTHHHRACCVFSGDHRNGKNLLRILYSENAGCRRKDSQNLLHSSILSGEMLDHSTA